MEDERMIRQLKQELLILRRKMKYNGMTLKFEITYMHEGKAVTLVSREEPIEKASRLKELLQEVTTLINSLGCRKENEILIIETPSAPLKSLDEIRTMIKRNFGSVEVR
jgi:hypothetical protein